MSLLNCSYKADVAVLICLKIGEFGLSGLSLNFCSPIASRRASTSICVKVYVLVFIVVESWIVCMFVWFVLTFLDAAVGASLPLFCVVPSDEENSYVSWLLCFGV